MGLYAYSEFTSDQGVTYKINVYDSTYSGATTEFSCGADGFVLTYQGIGDERYQPIKSSSITFEMNVPDTSSTLYTLITNLQGGAQGRFKIKIERSEDLGINYYDFWHGVLIPDIAIFEDVPFPSFYKFTATDGLSLMKDIAFDTDVYQSAGDKATSQVFNHFIASMLRYYTGGIFEFFGATDTYIRELSHWYEDSMPTPAIGVSPFSSSSTYPYAFVDIKYNDEGEIVEEKPQSAYKVLEGILTAWGCRVWQQDGYWWIAHVNMWDDLSTYNLWYRRIDYTGTIRGSGSFSEASWKKEMGSTGYDITKIAGSTYSYMPEIKAVEAVYSNWGPGGLLDTEQTLSEWQGASYAAALTAAESALVSIGYVVNATNAAVTVIHNVEFSSNPGGAGSASWNDMLGLVYMLKVGAYYYDGLEWTTTQSVVTVPPLSTAMQFLEYGGGTIPLGPYPQIAFTTADLPASGELYYSVFKSQTLNNGIVDPIGANNKYNVTIKANAVSMPSFVIYTVNENTDIRRTFGSEDTSSDANIIIQLGEVPVGDGPTTGPPSWGRIRVYNGTTWLDTVEENWQAWETGTQDRITQILTEQCFFGQREFLPLNNYKLLLRDKAPLVFGYAIDDNTAGGIRMVPNGWSLNANTDEISGEFFKSTKDTSGITNTNTDIEGGMDMGGNWLTSL